jgi:hypothetical protein
MTYPVYSPLQHTVVLYYHKSWSDHHDSNCTMHCQNTDNQFTNLNPIAPLSFYSETSQSLGTLIMDQPMTNDQQPTTNNQQPTTNDQQPTAEELKYSCHRARRHQCPTNNLLEVWQNSAPFGGRPIGTTVEALLTKVLNQ